MTEYRLALVREVLEPATPVRLDAGRRAWWIEAGEARINGESLAADSGLFTSEAVDIEATSPIETSVLRFEISTMEQPADPRALLVETAEFEPAESLLRLDTVRFPPGATAYRHVHAGAGIRYLCEGSLEIVTDHGSETMASGEAWFEPANSPVTANASPHVKSAFVRAMVIPKSYAGVSTFKLCDPADADRPRRQETHRYFDAELS